MLWHSTNLLVDVGLILVLNEGKWFDLTIKTKILTPWYLLKALNKPLKLAHFTRFIMDFKIAWLHNINALLKLTIENSSFNIHLLNLIVASKI
jgi:hypothetical protein